jgi:large subunit ribosomal protein L13
MTDKNKLVTIDAKDQPIGRVATKIANALRGKDSPSFERHVLPDVKVTVVNASKLKIDERKLESKSYKRYSGYPGGLKTRTLKQSIEKKGYAEPLRHAIKGMLPANKLRAKILNNLTINE